MWHFFAPSGYLINSVFQWQYFHAFFSDSIQYSCFCGSIFPLNYENSSGHYTFQSGDMLQGALTHEYSWHLNGMVLWGHTANEIHISTCRRCMDTKLYKVLTKCKRIPNMTVWPSDQSGLTWPFEKSISLLSQGL